MQLLLLPKHKAMQLLLMLLLTHLRQLLLMLQMQQLVHQETEECLQK
jgi:hypothetical protein